MTPDFPVSTADAYRWLDEDRGSRRDGLDSLVMDPLSLSTWAAVERFARNDFEAPVMAVGPTSGPLAAAA